MKKFSIITFGLIALAALFTGSCKKDDNGNDNTSPAGKLQFTFQHYVDGNPVIYDSLMYVNAAGNHYLVYEVQYFVTDVVLYKHGGGTKTIDDWTDYHYVDSNIPNSLKWDVYDSIDPGDYDSLAFHFGFSIDKNKSFMFVNPPESNMVWPEYLGGGYHYMKLNGKWLDTNNVRRGFAFHLGIGQHYDSTGAVVPPFIDNSFRVSLPGSSFSVSDGKTTKITIRMNIEQWFKDPVVYDHNKWGGDIMQKQPAMATAVKNGHNVFEFVK